ncbi:MAG: glycosyltransferase [Janthinobacterium lividum]
MGAFVRRIVSDAWQRFGRLIRSSLPGDFSVADYLELNPDLTALSAAGSSLEAHYVASGKAEGRLFKLDEHQYGQLPADFDVNTYLDINPDLEQFRGRALAAKKHYLLSGRSEGRSYKIATPSRERRKPSILRLQPPKAWQDLFIPGDFRALHPDLAGKAATSGALLAAFEARGIDALAALSLDRTFDPVFYAALFPETAALAPVARYRAWLEEGLPAGRPGSETEALQNLLGISDYPKAFDWRRYAAQVGSSASGWPRIRCLEHLVAVGAARGDAIPLSAEKGSLFLLAISDVLWTSGRQKPALDVLRQAIELDPEDAALHHQMAGRCIESGRQRDAEHHERRAFDLGLRSVWAYVNLAGLATQRGDVEESYRLLGLSRDRFEGLAPWRQALRDAIEAEFAAAADRAWEMYRAGARAQADADFTAALTKIADRIRLLEDIPGRTGPTEGGHVVLFANHLLPQCRHYRVEQRCQQFEKLGLSYRVFASEDAESAREALIGASALILYREPAFPKTIRLLLHAQAMGIPTFYDIDDLIFDPAYYPEAYATYEKQISLDSYLGLLYGTPLIRFAISLCDAGLASTTALAQHVAPLTLSKRCHVVPNGLDSRNARFLKAPVVRGEDSEIVILYGSGSQAHNRNFNETVGAALLELMEKNPRVILAVAGYLDLDPAFALYANRIRSFPFSRNLQSYWGLLSEVDINLAVLTPGAMNDSKSEIKWLEAAASGVPSIVSASARYSEVVEDGVDGVLADSPEAWRRALFGLVEDRALRRRIGLLARERALRDYALESTAEQLLTSIAPTMPLPCARLRVLVVHVLFPPQSSGGATRVVRDNVDDILDRYGDEIELAVYTTDFDAPVVAEEAISAGARLSCRVGHYRTIPVFRTSRGSDTEFTYRDGEAGRCFASVLASWKPHLVHFHCVQFLTGSVVEVCAEFGIPYIVTLHDAWWISPHQFLIDEDYLLREPAGSRALINGAVSMAEVDRRRFLGDQLAGAVALLAVSNSFAEVYRRAGFPQTRSLPNGLSALFLQPPSPRPLRAAGRIKVGHIGGLSRHKGSHLLRLALEMGTFDRIEAIVIDHAMSPDQSVEVVWGTTPVTVRGPAEQDGVRALYEDLHVLIAPSIWPESYGLVSREASAMGLWVVASDLGALGEDVIEGEDGFLIDVRDATDLGRVLRIIDADPDRFRAPPSRRVQPRLASAQADDLMTLYRQYGAPPAAT